VVAYLDCSIWLEYLTILRLVDNYPLRAGLYDMNGNLVCVG
jgi:hypothetical protein